MIFLKKLIFIVIMNKWIKKESKGKKLGIKYKQTNPRKEDKVKTKNDFHETNKRKIYLNDLGLGNEEYLAKDLYNKSHTYIENINHQFIKKSRIDLSNFQTYIKINIKKLFFLLIIYLSLFNKCNQENILFKISEVTLKIKGAGNIRILSSEFFKNYTASEIYLNDSLLEETKYKYYFDRNDSEIISIVKIKWNDIIISSAYKMFLNCDKIIEIDLSHFDASNIYDMSGMFYNCISLISINFTNINTSSVNNMRKMFYNCTSLKNLDLSNFDTSLVINMTAMFYYCSSLESIDLSHFNTSQVIYMNSMFTGCSKLKNLDLSNFDTSNVNHMNKMFYVCSSLKILKISKFNTSNVLNMKRLFSECRSLSSLDLSNFDTSKVTDMSYMFNNCNLTSLNLSNFNTSNVENMESMFYKITKLISLNLSNFDTSHVSNMALMFCKCNSLKELNIYNFDTSQVNKMDIMFAYCSSLSSLNLANFDTSKVDNTSLMFYNCSSLNSLKLYNFDTSQVKDMTKMFYNCGSLISLDLSNFNNSNVMYMNEMFSGCINLALIKIQFTNPYSETDNIFLQTHENLMICGENDFDILLNIFKQNIFHCKNKSGPYSGNKYKCIMKSLILNNSYANNICEEMIIIYYNNLIEMNNSYEFYYEINENSHLLEINFKNQSDDMNKTLQNIIINLINDINITEINSGKDKKIVDKNKVIILTSTVNQKINEDVNNITMDLGQCETNLKTDYNISKNDSLYILQIISEEEGMKIPKIEYEVYYPLYNKNNLTKLNLNSCKDTKIEISVAVKINDNIDKYNPKSEYYNDICSKATSESGTDISLKDRKNEYVNNNLSLCEENCELIEYNQEKEKAKCSCEIKLSIPLDNDIKFNKNDFFKSFTDIENIFNINIMKCYKTVLKVKNLVKNSGLYVAGSLIILYFTSLFIFVSVSYFKMKKNIYNIIFAIKNQGNPIKKKGNKSKKRNKKKKKNKYLEKKDINICNDNNVNTNLQKLNQEKKGDYGSQYDKCLDGPYGGKNQKDGVVDKNNLDVLGILSIEDFELNSLNYEEAFKLDNRTYFQYYFSLLKYNHPILFSFGTYNDYNSRIIKMFLFFFSLCLDLAVNALFFNDDTMHKIYEDKGNFNFLYQLPQIIYSLLISRLIDSIIRNLALSQENILNLKQEKNSGDLNLKYKKLLRRLKMKFILFFILDFIVLIFLSYYIACFCGIYVNTQIHLIKDSLISLITSLLVPFVLCLIPGILRISSLRVKKPNKKLLYKFSIFIENWLC